MNLLTLGLCLISINIEVGARGGALPKIPVPPPNAAVLQAPALPPVNAPAAEDIRAPIYFDAPPAGRSATLWR